MSLKNDELNRWRASRCSFVLPLLFLSFCLSVSAGDSVLQLKLVDEKGSDITLDEKAWRSVASCLHVTLGAGDVPVRMLENHVFEVNLGKNPMQHKTVRVWLDANKRVPYRCNRRFGMSEMLQDARRPIPVTVRKIEPGVLKFQLVSTLSSKPLTGYEVVLEIAGGPSKKAVTDKLGEFTFGVDDKNSASRITMSLLDRGAKLEQFLPVAMKEQMFDKENWPWIVKTRKPLVLGELCARRDEKNVERLEKYEGTILYEVKPSTGIGFSSYTVVEKGRFAIYDVGERRGPLFFRLPSRLSAFYIETGKQGPSVEPGCKEIKSHRVVLKERYRIKHTVRVIDARSREPVPQAIVLLKRASDKSIGRPTDASGNAGFEGLLCGSYRVTVSRGGYVQASDSLNLFGKGQSQLLLVPLVNQVLNISASDGTTMAGARVAVFAAGTEQRSCVTDSRGQCQLAGVPFGEGLLAVVAAKSSSMSHIGRYQFGGEEVMRIRCAETTPVELSVDLPEHLNGDATSLHVVEDGNGISVLLPDAGRKASFRGTLPPGQYGVYIKTATGPGRIAWYEVGEMTVRTGGERRAWRFQLTDDMLGKPQRAPIFVPWSR